MLLSNIARNNLGHLIFKAQTSVFRYRYSLLAELEDISIKVRK